MTQQGNEAAFEADQSHLSMQQRDVILETIQQAYRWAKKDPSFTLPEGTSSAILMDDVWTRAWMAIRGVFTGLRLRRMSFPFFVGRGVRIRGHRSLAIGRGATLADYVRIDARSRQGVKIGNNFTLREHSIIECTGVIRFPGEGLVIGNDVGISQFCFIGVRGPVRIGNHVQIGPRVTIYAENHNFEDAAILIREQGVRRAGIVIEDDCWLGANSVILDGVTIGKGSVIAAGSVVTKDVPPLSVAGGVPARIIRRRESSQA